MDTYAEAMSMGLPVIAPKLHFHPPRRARSRNGGAGGGADGANGGASGQEGDGEQGGENEDGYEDEETEEAEVAATRERERGSAQQAGGQQSGAQQGGDRGTQAAAGTQPGQSGGGSKGGTQPDAANGHDGSAHVVTEEDLLTSEAAYLIDMHGSDHLDQLRISMKRVYLDQRAARLLGRRARQAVMESRSVEVIAKLIANGACAGSLLCRQP
jgi:hypothetical protein